MTEDREADDDGQHGRCIHCGAITDAWTQLGWMCGPCWAEPSHRFAGAVIIPAVPIIDRIGVLDHRRGGVAYRGPQRR